MLKMTSLRKGCVIIRTADLHKAGNALVHSAFGNVYAEVQIPKVTNYHQIRIRYPLYNTEIMHARIENLIALRERLSTFADQLAGRSSRVGLFCAHLGNHA